MPEPEKTMGTGTTSSSTTTITVTPSKKDGPEQLPISAFEIFLLGGGVAGVGAGFFFVCAGIARLRQVSLLRQVINSKRRAPPSSD